MVGDMRTYVNRFFANLFRAQTQILDTEEPTEYPSIGSVLAKRSVEIAERRRLNADHRQFSLDYLCKLNSAASRTRWLPLQACPLCLPHFEVDNDAALDGHADILTKSVEFTRHRSYLAYLCRNIVYAVGQKFPVVRFEANTKDLVSSNRVQKGISSALLDRGNMSEKEEQKERSRLTKEASRILMDMRAEISSPVLRFAAYVLNSVLPWIIRSIWVRPSQLRTIRETTDPRVPVVYLPLHRSHMDYVMLTYILWHYGMAPPLVAAGDNLNVPIISWFLRRLGGFFIRRNLDKGGRNGRKDYVYRAVLHEYVVKLLKAGCPLEFYIEAGRSRSGKSLLPKSGLLSIIVDAVAQGDVDDALIVPVSIAYERNLEGVFSSELMGGSKMKESVGHALRSFWKTFRHPRPDVRLEFGAPQKLTDLLYSMSHVATSGSEAGSPPISRRSSAASLASSHNSGSPPFLRATLSTASLDSGIGTQSPTRRDRSDRMVVSAVARHVLAELDLNKPITCTNIVAAALGSGALKESTNVRELAAAFEVFVNDLTKRNVVLGLYLSDNYEGLVRRALLMMSRSVKLDRKSGVVVVSKSIKCQLDLAYYANALSAIYAPQAVVYLAARHMESQRDAPDDPLTKVDLLDSAAMLMNLFHFEFVFLPPCVSVENLLNAAYFDLIDKGLLVVDQNLSDTSDPILGGGEADLPAVRWRCDPHHGECFAVCQPSSWAPLSNYLKGLLTPYSLAYKMVCDKLLDAHKGGIELTEQKLMKQIQAEIRAGYEAGKIAHAAAMSGDTLRNGLKYLASKSMFEHHPSKIDGTHKPLKGIAAHHLQDLSVFLDGLIKC